MRNRCDDGFSSFLINFFFLRSSVLHFRNHFAHWYSILSNNGWGRERVRESRQKKRSWYLTLHLNSIESVDQRSDITKNYCDNTLYPISVMDIFICCLPSLFRSFKWFFFFFESRLVSFRSFIHLPVPILILSAQQSEWPTSQRSKNILNSVLHGIMYIFIWHWLDLLIAYTNQPSNQYNIIYWLCYWSDRTVPREYLIVTQLWT